MSSSKKHKYDNAVKATLTGIIDLFRKHEKAGELLPSDRLDGKTVLVDGASSGLGFAVATECARRGARVIMACRSGIPEKGEKVKKASGSDNVQMLSVDFSDFRSVLRLAEDARKAGPVDIYVCNAGIVPKKSRQTLQGMEEMFMVNYFSKFIFVNALIENDCFSHGSPESPRIIFIASESHRNPVRFDWDSFGVYKPYGISKSMELYGYYKLLLTAFSVELSRRLNNGAGKLFSVFTLCPGPINSNIGREAPAIFQPLLKLVLAVFFRSPEKAAIPVIYMAASKEQEGKPFDYFFLMSRQEVDGKASDPVNGRKLWELSERLREKVFGKNEIDFKTRINDL